MYSFSAKTSERTAVTGLIAARSSSLAHHRIKKIGLNHISVRVDPMESIKELFGAQANQRQLTMFYRVLGQRLKTGEGNVNAALEQAQSFLLDGRLKSMVAIFHASLGEGSDLNTAMLAAGFDEREAMVVKALSDGAERGEAFLSLASEVEAREALRRRFSSMLRMPKFVGGFAYAMMPGYVFLLAPKTAHFLADLGNEIQISPGIEAFYRGVGVLIAHPVAFALVYCALPAGLIWLARTEWFRLQLERIPMVRDISEKRDHATLWHSFALMYKGGIPQGDALRTLARTVNRIDTRRSLTIAARRLSSGDDEIRAITNAKFPPWAVAGFRGAKLSGDLSDGLLRFAKTVKEDLDFAVDNLAHYSQVGSVIVMAVIVLFFFLVTVYPMIAPVLSNL
jgi:type II secretory pathway component PulF